MTYHARIEEATRLRRFASGPFKFDPISDRQLNEQASVLADACESIHVDNFAERCPDLVLPYLDWRKGSGPPVSELLGVTDDEP